MNFQGKFTFWEWRNGTFLLFSIMLNEKVVCFRIISLTLYSRQALWSCNFLKIILGRNFMRRYPNFNQQNWLQKAFKFSFRKFSIKITFQLPNYPKFSWCHFLIRSSTHFSRDYWQFAEFFGTLIFNAISTQSWVSG